MKLACALLASLLLAPVALAWKATLPTTVDPSCVSTVDRTAAPSTTSPKSRHFNSNRVL